MVGVSQPSLPSIKLSPAKQKAFLKAGKKLMSAEYFDCWSCHQKGERKPEGPMEGWAPDLEISSQRLRRDWIVQWLRDPQKLMPGTKMPTYFEGSDSHHIFAYVPDQGGGLLFRQAEVRHSDLQPGTDRVRLLQELEEPAGAELASEVRQIGCYSRMPSTVAGAVFKFGGDVVAGVAMQGGD